MKEHVVRKPGSLPHYFSGVEDIHGLERRSRAGGGGVGNTFPGTCPVPSPDLILEILKEVKEDSSDLRPQGPYASCRCINTSVSSTGLGAREWGGLRLRQGAEGRNGHT